MQNVEDTEEVVQDTLLATLQGLEQFKNESSLRTWVYSIAINKCKDALKHKHRKKRYAQIISLSKHADTDGLDVVPTNFVHPGILLESEEQMEMLFEGINRLPEKQKQAIILTKLEQMSMNETAEIMNTTPKAVESLVSRAKTNLTTYLETEGISITKKKK